MFYALSFWRFNSKKGVGGEGEKKEGKKQDEWRRNELDGDGGWEGWEEGKSDVWEG